jgi:ribose transport system permease protein
MQTLEARNNPLSRFLQVSWVSILLGVIFLAAALSILQPSFRSLTNFKNIFQQSSVVAVIAVGMTFVILSGGIDISVGMNVFLMCAGMYVLSKFMPAGMVLTFGIIGGAVIGIVNGFLVCVLRITPIIATLSTLAICRGIAYMLIESKMKVVAPAVRVIGASTIGRILPVPILIMIAMAILGYFLLKYTRFGRYVLAIGNSTVSARESGIPIYKMQFATYALCGLCAGIASTIYIGRLGTVQTNTAWGLEFTVITAVVLGGTKLSGGKGTIIGSIIGCIFLTLIENALSLMEVSGFYYDVVRGGILFLAVAIEAVSSWRQNKALLAERSRRLRIRNIP